MKTKTWKERLESEIYMRFIGCHYPGETDWIVKTGKNIGAETITTVGERYSGRISYYKTNAKHVVTVSPKWQATVEAKGLSDVNGILTLGARKVDQSRNTLVYKAVILTAKGKRLRGEDCFIARHGKAFAHGKTQRSALQALRRKRIIYITNRQNSKRRDPARLIPPDTVVKYGHSTKAGNCRIGTSAFCNQHLDGRKEATVEELRSLELDTATRNLMNKAIAMAVSG